MPDGDVLKATLEGTFGGEPVMIGLGFIAGAGTPDFNTDAQALYDAVYVALSLGASTPPFMDPLSAQYKLDSIRISDVNPGLSASQVFSVGLIGGNATDDALPPNDALCVTWRDGLKGQAHRGRSFLTGFAEDSQNAGYWIPEIQTWAKDEFADPLMANFGPISSSGYRLALIHTSSAGSPITPPTATPIISYSIHNNVRSLRRRAVGVRISRHPSA